MDQIMRFSMSNRSLSMEGAMRRLVLAGDETGMGQRTIGGTLLLLAASLSFIGCASNLPTGRVSYASEVTHPDVPSVRTFVLAEDRPGCEAAIATMRNDFVPQHQQKIASRIDFGGCRMAVLEPGSEYWAVLTDMMPGNAIIMGSNVQRFCDSTAKQYISRMTRCTPTNIRFINVER